MLFLVRSSRSVQCNDGGVGHVKVAAIARTDFDGFFLFERVPYGEYTVRASKESAAAAKIAADFGVRLKVSPDKSIVRLGAIAVTPAPQIAAAALAPKAP